VEANAEEVTVKKLILVGTAVVALAIGTVGGLALSTMANPKLVVSCEARSCSVQLPGPVLDEMNKTMTKSMSQATESEKAQEEAFLKEFGKLFEQPPAQHDAASKDKDSGAEFVREFKKLFE
jgi:hypothetical protein